MKNLTTTRPKWAGQRLPFFLIFFFSLSVAFADTFYVSTTGNDSNDGSQARPWRTVARAAAVVPAGSHTIVVAAGTYDEGVMELKPGVSLQGAGRDRTTIRNRTFDWWRGAIRLNSASVMPGNQTVSALTLDGINASGFEGIQVHNRTGVKLLDIRVRNFFHCGIDIQASPGMTVRDIEIANFELVETARESGGGSYGAITVRGNMENLYFHDGVIYHQSNNPVGPTSDRASGYAMKFFPTFSNGGFNNNTEYISNSRIQRIRDIGKSTAAWGNNVPNIGIEFWNIGGSEVEISDCDFTTHLSLEFNPNTHKGRYSFWVRNNRFAVGSGQSIELAVSNAIVEGNIFDYRSNTNAWNVIGEYNDKPRGAGNIHIRRNYFVTGNSSPILWSVSNPATGLYFYNNTVCGAGGVGMFRFDPGVSNDLRVVNNAFDLGNNISLCSYWSSATPPTGLTVANNHHSRPFADIPAGTALSNNRQVAPAISRSGVMPLPYLNAVAGGALIDAGLTTLPAAPLPMAFAGNAPEVGAFENGQAAAPAPVAANQPPAVQLTAPTDKATTTAGSSLTLTASSSDADGSVAKVEFFAGANKIGEKTAAPWGVTWGNVPQGTHSLTARATDDKGATITSAAVTVTANAVVAPPPVAITPPPASVQPPIQQAPIQQAPPPVNNTPSATTGNGLRGEFFTQFGTNVARARTAIAPAVPAYTFTATNIDYPSGTTATGALALGWGPWLGADGSNAPAQTLETSTVRLSGFIQIAAQNDVIVGNNTIEVNFTLFSQGFAALTVNGAQVITNEANWSFSSRTARVSFPAPGLYPIEILQSVAWDASGLELYSSIAGGANGSRGTIATPTLVPRNVLFTNRPTVAVRGARQAAAENPEFAPNTGLVLYPNPSDGSLVTITDESFEEGQAFSLAVYDLSGRTALQTSVSATNKGIQLTGLGLGRGLYTVVLTGDGLRKQTRMLIQ